MKTFYLSLLICFIQINVLMAQAPGIFNYQGVARSETGAPLSNMTISVKVTIRSASPMGAIAYSETRSVVTNSFGLFSLPIGAPGATVNYGSFDNIQWSSGAKYLQTELSINGGAFTDLGTTQIMSVPYAINSKEAHDLVLPYSKSTSLSGNLFHIQNNNVNVNASAISATSGAGRAFYGSATTGTAGYFLSQDGDAVYAYSPNKVGLRASSNSQTGYGVFASNFNGGYALGVSGNLRIFGGNTNPGAGKVLTSDAMGNATWQASAASGATIGFLAKNPAQGGLQNLPSAAKYKIHAAVEEFDGSSNYSLYNQTPSSTFTATVAGLHRFHAKVQISASGGNQLDYADLFLVHKRGNTETELSYVIGKRNVIATDIELDHTIYLIPGDQVWLAELSKVNNGSNPVLTSVYFSGYRIK